MTDALLIQQVYPGGGMEKLLDLTHKRHFSYCEIHAFDFHSVRSNVVEKWPKEMGGWAKIELLYRAVASHIYKYVVWLDADTIIEDPTVDLRLGCPSRGIGAVRFQHNTFAPHWNVGALYMQATKSTEETLKTWLEKYPGPDNQREQGVFNSMGSPHATTIEDTWNYTKDRCNPIPNPAVLGFHSIRGTDSKITSMIEALS